MYPVFLKLSGRRGLLVGGGPVAAGKLAGLLADGAQVTVVAPEIRSELHQPGVRIVRRAFDCALQSMRPVRAASQRLLGGSFGHRAKCRLYGAHQGRMQRAELG